MNLFQLKNKNAYIEIESKNKQHQTEQTDHKNQTNIRSMAPVQFSLLATANGATANTLKHNRDEITKHNPLVFWALD